MFFYCTRVTCERVYVTEPKVKRAADIDSCAMCSMTWLPPVLYRVRLPSGKRRGARAEWRVVLSSVSRGLAAGTVSASGGKLFLVSVAIHVESAILTYT